MSKGAPLEENDRTRQNLSNPSHNTESAIEFRRLTRLLSCQSSKPEEKKWHFCLIDCPEKADQDFWIQRINDQISEMKLGVGQLDVSAQVEHFGDFKDQMKQLSTKYQVVHVLNSTDWFISNLEGRRIDEKTRELGSWDAFNVHRENFAHNCRATWLFWGGDSLIKSCQVNALDLWTWRAGVYCLAPNDDAALTPPHVRAD
jgi:hypothetical protein